MKPMLSSLMDKRKLVMTNFDQLIEAIADLEEWEDLILVTSMSRTYFHLFLEICEDLAVVVRVGEMRAERIYKRKFISHLQRAIQE